MDLILKYLPLVSVATAIISFVILLKFRTDQQEKEQDEVAGKVKGIDKEFRDSLARMGIIHAEQATINKVMTDTLKTIIEKMEKAGFEAHDHDKRITVLESKQK